MFWITHAKAIQAPNSDVYLEEDGILRCVGRVPGYFSIPPTRECELTSQVVLQAHRQMLYGGVSVTVSHEREVLGSETKVIHNLMIAKSPYLS